MNGCDGFLLRVIFHAEEWRLPFISYTVWCFINRIGWGHGIFFFWGHVIFFFILGLLFFFKSLMKEYVMDRQWIVMSMHQVIQFSKVIFRFHKYIDWDYFMWNCVWIFLHKSRDLEKFRQKVITEQSYKTSVW